MKKYEIMVLVNGNLSEADATKIITKMKGVLKDAKNLKETSLGLKDMAYEIKKCSKAHYFVLNFELDKPESIKEFNRLSLINKDILRHLIVNIEKNYGYRASINAKKIASSKIKAARFEKIKKKREEELAAKKTKWEAKKAEFKKEIKTEEKGK